MSGQKMAPWVFINGSFLGGHEATSTANSEEKLKPMVNGDIPVPVSAAMAKGAKTAGAA